MTCRSWTQELRAIWILVICVTVFLGACPIVCASDDIRIAMVTAKTGEAGRSNAISFQGARFAVDVINASGGILGRAVQLLEYDNQGSPEGSADAGRMAVKDGAVAVVGCNWSSHSLAMAQVLQASSRPHDLPHLHQCGRDPGGRLHFSHLLYGRVPGQRPGPVSPAAKSSTPETAVVLVDVSRTYSKGLAGGVRERLFEKSGGRVLWRGEYETSTLECRLPVAPHRSEVRRPDVLFVPGGYADEAAVVRGGRGNIGRPVRAAQRRRHRP